MFGQHFIAIISLQGRGIVLDEALIFKWISNEFEVKWDVWKTVAVLYSANDFGTGKI